MKKFQTLLVLTVAMCLLVSMLAVPASASEPKVETVRVWTNDTSLKPLYDEAIAEFEATVGKEKGIKIDFQVFGADYHDVLKVALAADQGPEIYKFVGTTKDSFIDSGWMVSLEDFPDHEELLAQWKDVIIPEYNTNRGKVYSLPVKALITKFIYNKTLFEKNGIANPPATWAELVEDARIITENGDGEVYGYGMHLKNAGSSGKWYIATQFAGAVGHMGYDFAKGEYRFIDFAPIMDCFQQMRKDDSIFPGFEGMIGDNWAAQFAAGRIGIIPGVGWDVKTFNDTFKVEDDWGVFNAPALDSAKRYKNYGQPGDLVCMGPAAKAMPEKAMIVYSFLHGEGLLQKMQEQGLEFVGLPAIQEKVTTAPFEHGWKEFADTSNNYFTMTPPDGALTDLEGLTYQNVLCNMMAEDLTPEQVRETLTDLDKRYNDALKRAVDGGFDLSKFINADWDTSMK